MADKKAAPRRSTAAARPAPIPRSQEPATKKAAPASRETETKPVVDLLTNILEEFRQQVPSRAAAPLEPAALQAQRAFIEISDQLDVEPE